VYAKWDENSFIVTINPNGGTFQNADGGGTANITRTVYASKPYVVLATGGMPGYPHPPANKKFSFWAIGSETGSPFDEGEKITETITVVAVWDTISISGPSTGPSVVTFSENHKDGKSDYATITVKSPKTNTGFLPPEPSRVDHKFMGWNTSYDGLGTSFNETSTVTGSIRVHAQWAKATGTTWLTGYVDLKAIKDDYKARPGNDSNTNLPDWMYIHIGGGGSRYQGTKDDPLTKSPGGYVDIQKIFVNSFPSTVGANYVSDASKNQDNGLGGFEKNAGTDDRYKYLPDNRGDNLEGGDGGYEYRGALQTSKLNAATANYLGFVYRNVFGDARFAIGNENATRAILFYFDQLVAPPENVTGSGKYVKVTYKDIDGSDIATFTVPQGNPIGDALLMDYLPVRTRTGYNFGYWTTKPNDGTPATKMVQVQNPSATVLELLPANYGMPVTPLTLVESNIDLYVLWTNTDTFVVVYDANGGKFSTGIPTANGGGSKQPIARAVTAPNTKLDQNGNQHSAWGYPGQAEDGGGFGGWFDNTNGTGTNYSVHNGGGGQWEVEAEWKKNNRNSLILYAKWNN
jgi:hypothetical protein